MSNKLKKSSYRFYLDIKMEIKFLLNSIKTLLIQYLYAFNLLKIILTLPYFPFIYFIIEIGFSFLIYRI